MSMYVHMLYRGSRKRVQFPLGGNQRRVRERERERDGLELDGVGVRHPLVENKIFEKREEVKCCTFDTTPCLGNTRIVPPLPVITVASDNKAR